MDFRQEKYDVIIALACFSFKVMGGRERDCLEIARGLAAYGHRVFVLTCHPPPSDVTASENVPLEFAVFKQAGSSNHSRLKHFSDAIRSWRNSQTIDALIGFEKLPNLNYYYAAAQPLPSYGPPKCWLPRYRMLNWLEGLVFGPDSHTFIFYLSSRQLEDYRNLYALVDDRHVMLPPTIHPDRMAPETFYASRAETRRQLQIPSSQRLLLSIAAYGRQKGVDRVINTLIDFPDTALLSVGLKDPESMMTLAQKMGVSDRFYCLEQSPNVADFAGAADLMVHPARTEATGTVIVESLLYGIPVITSGLCGYASHVANSEAGMVLAEPFRQRDLRNALAIAASPEVLTTWRRNARAYSDKLVESGGMAGVVRIIHDTLLRRHRAN